MDDPVLEQMRAIYPHHGEAEEGGQPGVHNEPLSKAGTSWSLAGLRDRLSEMIFQNSHIQNSFVRCCAP